MTSKLVSYEGKSTFNFSKEAIVEIKKVVNKYPKGKQRSAVLPLLYIAQKENGGYLSFEAMDCVAGILEMPKIEVYEVANFYTLLHTKPTGKNIVQVCTTVPCCLRGADKIKKACEKKLGIKTGENSRNGDFTLLEVECLGACVHAPVVQINEDFYEDLTVDKMEEILDKLEQGNKVNPLNYCKNRIPSS